MIRINKLILVLLIITFFQNVNAQTCYYDGNKCEKCKYLEHKIFKLPIWNFTKKDYRILDRKAKKKHITAMFLKGFKSLPIRGYYKGDGIYWESEDSLDHIYFDNTIQLFDKCSKLNEEICSYYAGITCFKKNKFDLAIYYFSKCKGNNYLTYSTIMLAYINAIHKGNNQETVKLLKKVANLNSSEVSNLNNEFMNYYKKCLLFLDLYQTE